MLRERNWRPFPVPPDGLDAVVLTHGHLDHSGYLPVLVRDGFDGPIHCTEPTADLREILLPDAGHLQEEDAHYRNKKRATRHRPALPLFTEAQARETCRSLVPALGQAAGGEVNGKSRLTLRQAWSRYRGHLIAKGRSGRMLEAYELASTHVSDWLDMPLGRLADDPDLVAERHQKITENRGPIIANRVMRAVRAVYRARTQTAARPGSTLRASVCGRGLEHGERRDTALTPETAPKCYKRLNRFDNSSAARSTGSRCSRARGPEASSARSGNTWTFGGAYFTSPTRRAERSAPSTSP